MIRQPLETRWKIVLGLASVVAMLLAYTAVSVMQHRDNPDDTTIPTWRQLGEGVKMVVEPNHRSGERWLVGDAAATAQRLFLGLLSGVLGALALGLLLRGRRAGRPRCCPAPESAGPRSAWGRPPAGSARCPGPNAASGGCSPSAPGF